MAMLQQLQWLAMKSGYMCLIAIIFCGIASVAENKGICPPAPTVDKHPATINSDESNGTISVLAVISDKGYVCTAQVIRGLDKRSNAEAEKTVRQWRFTPAKKDGHAVPVVVTVQVNYERDKNGNVIISSSKPTPPEEAPKK
jgi:TonB family protein